MSQPCVAIVDSYAPTARLAQEFRQAGASLIRVQSTAEVPRVYEGGFSLDGYLDNIVHDGDLDVTRTAVARHAPLAVVAGGEVGVELADALSAELALPSNGVALSHARRDKYAMMEAVRSAGVPAARQILVESTDQLIDWHRSIGGRIVVKPIRSAAGDGVAFCATPEEAASAYDRVLNTTNVFSVRNTGVVAMEYLRGAEYMVDTVSRDGRHHVTDIWLTTRISVNGVLDLGDTAYLLPRRGGEQDLLVAYAGRVLDALGIRHGPAHVEVKLTAAGPMLVEMGARICGGDLPYYAKVALGESQLDWTVDAYLDPDRFLARCDEDYPTGPAFASVTLISPVEGVLGRYRHLETLQALESFYDIRIVVQPGQRITRTVDDTGYPMLITLMHDAEETVRRDAGTIRYFDGEGLYELAAEAGDDHG